MGWLLVLAVLLLIGSMATGDVLRKHTLAIALAAGAVGLMALYSALTGHLFIAGVWGVILSVQLAALWRYRDE